VSELALFWLQRLSAMVLAPLVVTHLAVILYAMHGGLSAAEILARTQGNVAWAVFYALFVVAVAVHAPIGLRNIARESTAWRGAGLDRAMVLLGIALLALGLRALWALFA